MTPFLVRNLARRLPRVANNVRFFSSQEPMPPGYSLESIQPPEDFALIPDETTIRKPDPMAHQRMPVHSAHMIVDNALSLQDSVSVDPSGSILHGRYGNLGQQEHVPLEYMALLRPAAEGAAACRQLGHSGTVLVFGATQPAALAALQMWKGQAVGAVVGGEHSGCDEMLEMVKKLIPEPGFVVAEEYALWKKNFMETVQSTVKGDTMKPADPDLYLKDFQQNLVEYAKFYPDSRPAAVSADHLEFEGKEKDRENFRDNIDPYLSQFPAGSPPMALDKLEESFTLQQYEIFRAKFGTQTTGVITGDDVEDFPPGQIIAGMMESPEAPTTKTKATHECEIPFEFSLQRNDLMVSTAPAGGPIAGAIVAVTPDLLASATALAKCKTLREKAEALQFLTDGQRNAYAAASGLVALAKGKPVIVVGGTLPGFTSVETTDADVKDALAAMEIQEDETSILNFFVQVFRAGDYAIYEDYAIHRNAEGTPKQIIVTK